jgi:hypothetical protein
MIFYIPTFRRLFVNTENWFADEFEKRLKLIRQSLVGRHRMIDSYQYK